MALPQVEIICTGRLDDRDSSFPQAIQLENGDLLCSFSVGGGPWTTGGSDLARSTDGGLNWIWQRTLLPKCEETGATNHLKLSIAADKKTLYAYGCRQRRQPGQRFGEFFTEPIFCQSTDQGLTWSDPSVIPIQREGNFEISHGILPLRMNRLLAPAATLPSCDRLGEKVLVGISDDGGKSWPNQAVVFHDPDERLGFFEHKLAEVSSDLLVAVCWTVTLTGVSDQENHFSFSRDGGITWTPPRSTGMMGQTMTPIPLPGGNRLLVLYNRRYGQQGIVMSLVTFAEDSWQVQYEGLLYDALNTRQRDDAVDGKEELNTFEFGFPTAIRLDSGEFLATYWAKQGQRFGINWARLRVDW